MAELDSTYSSTNAALQGNINSALQGIDNMSRKVDQVGQDVGDLSVSPPSINTPSVNFPSAPPGVTVPSISAPNVAVSGTSMKSPASVSAKSFDSWVGPTAPTKFNGFEQFFGGTPDTPEDVIDRANAAVTAWVDAYFPSMSACFKDVPEQWICDVVSGVRPLGNSEEAIYVAWRAAKANEFALLRSNQRNLEAEFSQRGFSLPPGVLVAATQRGQERMEDAVAQVNREAALKDIDVQVQLLQTAVTVAADLKRGLATLMADYFRAVSSLADQTQQYNVEKARIKADAEARFMEGLLTYHRINQGYYDSLASSKNDHDRVRAAIYDSRVRASEAEARIKTISEELRLRAAEVNTSTAVAAAKNAIDAGRVQSDIFRTSTDAAATSVNAQVSVENLKAQVFSAVAEAEARVASVKASGGAGQAVAGVAKAFGDVAAAAANASGTLVAQIEGF